jgi:DUF4097 and DUF4098 domain-containing protein YvlB
MRKHAIFVVLAMFLLLFLCVPAVFAATETFHETYEVAPGTPFRVHNINGGIRLSAWDKDYVDVVAEKREQIGGNAKNVKIEVTVGDTITIETVHLVKYPRVSVNYTISVPAAIVVESVQSSNGAITLQNVHGDVTAETSNGAIDITGHTGTVRAKTSNGAIELNRIDGYVEAKTSNGAIKISGVSGLVSAETSNGSISTEIPGIQNDVRIKTSNGAIKVYLSAELDASVELKTSNGKIGLHDIEILTSEIGKTSLKGRIGDGGNLLYVKTSNGSIDVYRLE